jgi:hypothetical protein
MKGQESEDRVQGYGIYIGDFDPADLIIENSRVLDGSKEWEVTTDLPPTTYDRMMTALEEAQPPLCDALARHVTARARVTNDDPVVSNVRLLCCAREVGHEGDHMQFLPDIGGVASWAWTRPIGV